MMARLTAVLVAAIGTACFATLLVLGPQVGWVVEIGGGADFPVEPYDVRGEQPWMGVLLAGTLVGAVLVVIRPRHPIPWLLVATGTGFLASPAGLAIPNLVGVDALRSIAPLLDLLMAGFLVLPLVAAICLVLRFVRSTGVERQQMKWMAYGAAAFGPLRRRVQALVDLRFNRARYDVQRAVEAFSQRLRDEVDLDALHTDLVRITSAALLPVHASVWMPDPGGAS